MPRVGCRDSRGGDKVKVFRVGRGAAGPVVGAHQRHRLVDHHRFGVSDPRRLWCKRRRPISYIGVLSWLRSPMGKLKAVAELFEGRHFDREVIILCVRWYLRFKLSLRDLVEVMAERGLSMAYTTIMRWVQRYAPEFEKRWQRFARSAAHGGSTRPT